MAGYLGILSVCLAVVRGLPTTPLGTSSSTSPSVLAPRPSETFQRHLTLDPKGDYHLFWNLNDTHVTFETHVRTRGYVGFGISHNGNMFPADVIIGWVKDGKTHFTDRHATGHSEPQLDASQDWTLLSGEENDWGTVLKFVRKLDTCDSQEDIALDDSTTRFIYSYHPEDPEDSGPLPYHGATRRGTRSVMLLDSTTNDVLPSDSKHFDFRNRQFRVPKRDTFYHCTVYRFPDLDRKHHVVMVEPMVDENHTEVVHHMVLYFCPTLPDPSLFKAEYECYEQIPRGLDCQNVYFAWGSGGEAVFLPDQAGLPLGTEQDPRLFILETHYNNPTLRDDIVDSSGLRLHYTTTLRPHDAGVLNAGIMVNNWHIIPPHYPSFVSRGYCSSRCTEQGFQNLTDNSIRIFANFPHSHLLGRAIRTRHFRQGKELEPILVDNYYDFNFQDYHLFRKEVVVKAGDTLMVECEYNSSKMTRATFGGLSTAEEMCLSFMLYYPRSRLTECQSLPAYDNVGSLLPLAQYHKPTEAIHHVDFTNSTLRQLIQEAVDRSSIYVRCQDELKQFTADFGERVPQISSPYIPSPSSQCSQG